MAEKSSPRTLVHMIGQAHLDPAWLWTWPEGRAEAVATAQSAVDRLDEYAGFRFVRGEAQVYQWIEEEDPELFSRIRELIAQRRWHVVNGMLVQPDMNLPQGEALVRQCLLGKEYMREHLGVEPTVAYCVDSFGHAGTLPQIFRKCGFDSYVFMRPGPHEKTLPSQAFIWEAPDGSRVLAFRIAASYCTGHGDHRAHIGKAIASKPPQIPHTMCFFGVGNHGGGPTRRQIENVQQIARERRDIDLEFSDPESYFDAIQVQAPGLPVVRDELQFHAVGCYSANSRLKRIYRRAESGLLTAERLSVLAALWAARAVPFERLKDLWQCLCFNQFHDILDGCAIKEAEDQAEMALGRVLVEAQEISNTSGRAIAARIDTSGTGGNVVLFNVLPHASEQYVEYEPWTDRQPWGEGAWGLFDEQGERVACQMVETHEARSTSRDGIRRILFRTTVPAMGYRRLRFSPGAPSQRAPAGSVKAWETGVENDRLRLCLEPTSGNIVSCVDRATGIEMVGAGGWNVAQVLEDRSDTWSHKLRRYDCTLGSFGSARIRVCDEGPMQASVIVERSYESSTWLQQIILRDGEAEILIRNWLYWDGHWKTVKLGFQLAADAPRAVHDVPFGWTERPCDGMEVPTQMWMDVSGTSTQSPHQSIGLALLDDGKYGCDVDGSSMRLTVLRSPPYAYHEPHVPGSKCRYDWLDQGPQEFSVVLIPHVGDWKSAEVVKKARQLNTPLVTITMHGHSGNLPPKASLLSLSSSELEISALKRAEDGEGCIVRIVDAHGRGGRGNLRWADSVFPIALDPFEVRTLRVTECEGRCTVQECDMLERPLRS